MLTLHSGMRSFVFVAVAIAVSAMAGAGEIPSAKPEEVGMSSEGLLHIGTAMQRRIEAGEIQGAVTVVARRGKAAWASGIR